MSSWSACHLPQLRYLSSVSGAWEHTRCEALVGPRPPDCVLSCPALSMLSYFLATSCGNHGLLEMLPTICSQICSLTFHCSLYNRKLHFPGSPTSGLQLALPNRRCWWKMEYWGRGESASSPLFHLRQHPQQRLFPPSRGQPLPGSSSCRKPFSPWDHLPQAAFALICLLPPSTDSGLSLSFGVRGFLMLPCP